MLITRDDGWMEEHSGEGADGGSKWRGGGGCWWGAGQLFILRVSTRTWYLLLKLQQALPVICFVWFFLSVSLVQYSVWSDIYISRTKNHYGHKVVDAVE